MGKGKRNREKKRKEGFPKHHHLGGDHEMLDNSIHAVERLIGDQKSQPKLVNLLHNIERFLIELKIRRLLEEDQPIPAFVNEALDLRVAEDEGLMERIFTEDGLSWKLTEKGEQTLNAPETTPQESDA